MGHLDYRPFSRRHRPHIQPLNANLFITFRLVGSIPNSVVRLYKKKKGYLERQLEQLIRVEEDPNSAAVQEQFRRLERFSGEWFLKFEEILHKARTGPLWISNDGVAERIAENLHRLDGEALRLDAYSLMSNHVHTVFQPLLSETDLIECVDAFGHPMFKSDLPALARIMQSIKGRSARECNQVLGRTGQFWEHESFDHVIRAGKFNKTLLYVLNNPVKAGMVDEWAKWRWNYCREGLLEYVR
ncbi:MAG TPA: hypothetical protein VMM84_14415 [Pyrinomonadaceae bacterium]|nr:hypothetical protein [Pyrinomonadaceae bacterium]